MEAVGLPVRIHQLTLPVDQLPVPDQALVPFCLVAWLLGSVLQARSRALTASPIRLPASSSLRQGWQFQ